VERRRHRETDTVNGDAAPDVHRFGRDAFSRQVVRKFSDGNRLFLQLQSDAQVVAMSMRHGNHIRLLTEGAFRDERIDQDTLRSLQQKARMTNPG